MCSRYTFHTFVHVSQMHMCVYIFTHVCIYTDIYIYIYIYTYTYIYSHMYAYVHISMHKSIYYHEKYMHACTLTQTCYIYINMFIYMYIYMYIYIYMMHIYLHKHVNSYKYMYICKHICACILVHTCLHVYKQIYTYIHIYIHTYIYICTHAHTSICASWQFSMCKYVYLYIRTSFITAIMIPGHFMQRYHGSRIFYAKTVTVTVSDYFFDCASEFAPTTLAVVWAHQWVRDSIAVLNMCWEAFTIRAPRLRKINPPRIERTHRTRCNRYRDRDRDRDD
jgi:hypothetical protein